MSKVRKDNKGRPLHKGECYLKNKKCYSYSYTVARGRRVWIYAKDLAVLREKEKMIQKDYLDGLENGKGFNIDLNGVFDRYIQTKSNLKYTTKTGYIYTYNHFVRSEFGKRKIRDIRYSDVVLFYKSLVESGISVTTVDNIHCCIHPALQMALRDNLIRVNPTDGAMGEIKKAYKNTGNVRHALTYDQQMLFLNYLTESKNYKRWEPLFVLMFGTGVRIGEMMALTWSDIDFENNTIRVERTLTYRPSCDENYECNYHVTTPKTKNSRRTIPMLNKVREALLEEKRIQKETGKHNIMNVDGYSGFVFVGKNGTFHNAQAVNNALKILTAGANYKEELRAKEEGRDPIVIPEFSAHVIRHTFCTRLCESETNIKVIQTIMGHSDIQTTLDIYAEITDKKKQEVFEELNTKNII